MDMNTIEVNSDNENSTSSTDNSLQSKEFRKLLNFAVLLSITAVAILLFYFYFNSPYQRIDFSESLGLLFWISCLVALPCSIFISKSTFKRTLIISTLLIIVFVAPLILFILPPLAPLVAICILFIIHIILLLLESVVSNFSDKGLKILIIIFCLFLVLVVFLLKIFITNHNIQVDQERLSYQNYLKNSNIQSVGYGWQDCKEVDDSCYRRTAYLVNNVQYRIENCRKISQEDLRNNCLYLVDSKIQTYRECNLLSEELRNECRLFVTYRMPWGRAVINK